MFIEENSISYMRRNF